MLFNGLSMIPRIGGRSPFGKNSAGTLVYGGANICLSDLSAGEDRSIHCYEPEVLPLDSGQQHTLRELAE